MSFEKLNELTQSNIKTLYEELKPGQYFVVKKHKLFIQQNNSFFDKIKYFFVRRHIEQKVKKLISRTILDITMHISKDESGDLKKLFFGAMSQLPHRIYNRASIPQELSYLIEPELKNKKTMDKIDRLALKTQFAINLGVELKPISDGNSGSYFARDYKKKKLGIFKPGNEESLGSNTPKLIPRLRYLFLKHVLNIDTAAPFWPNEGYLAEAMTFKVARHMEFKTVPESKVEVLLSRSFANSNNAIKTSQKGSFQKFVKDADSADRILQIGSNNFFLGDLFLKLNMWRYKDQISKKVDQSEFEEMAVIDFAICNRDRHFDNWLLKSSGVKGKYNIHLIDHQLSFPKQNPSSQDVFYQRHQYKWEVLPQAKKKFGPEMREKIEKLLTGENLKILIKNLIEINDGEGFKKEVVLPNGSLSSQESAFKQRIAVLLLSLRNDYTLRQLAQFRTQEQIDILLQESGISDLDAFLRMTKEIES